MVVAIGIACFLAGLMAGVFSMALLAIKVSRKDKTEHGDW